VEQTVQLTYHLGGYDQAEECPNQEDIYTEGEVHQEGDHREEALQEDHSDHHSGHQEEDRQEEARQEEALQYLFLQPLPLWEEEVTSW
jgi:hypothetical protein